MFLPPYSPNLNMIEGLWKWLKNSVINNVFIHTKQEISARVKEFEKWVNQRPYQVIDRLCLAY
jgi:putative transposase